jgi:hypothetical protein
MAIDQIGTNAAKMALPEPNSDRPIMFWSTLVVTKTQDFEFELNTNINFPVPNNPLRGFAPAECRAMNIAVDLTVLNGNAVVYMSEYMIPCTYYANYSGIHPIIHYGIISVGAGILQLQSGT